MKDKLSLHEKQYGDELFWDKTTHTYLNMLVKLVYELSYMYIQCTGGMVLKDLC